MKTYDDYMKKAHGALILERENDIILELRATRDYLDSKIDVIDAKVDRLEIRVDSNHKELLSKVGSLESKLNEVLELLKK